MEDIYVGLLVGQGVGFGGRRRVIYSMSLSHLLSKGQP